MNIQKIQKKGFFLIFTILALFCLVNCGKDNDSPIEENNSKESISNENTSKELEALKKPIDLSALTFNEAIKIVKLAIVFLFNVISLKFIFTEFIKFINSY